MSKSVFEEQVNVEHGNKGAKRPSIRAESAKAWMTRYFHLVGGKMPHNKYISQAGTHRRMCIGNSERTRNYRMYLQVQLLHSAHSAASGPQIFRTSLFLR